MPDLTLITRLSDEINKSQPQLTTIGGTKALVNALAHDPRLHKAFNLAVYEWREQMKETK